MGPLPALLLLLGLLPPRAAPAPRARPLQGLLGCLFEDGLCRPSETCVNDGVFGRCQKVPAMDSHRYEVSRGARQHLTATLQKLSRTGFTWQDDFTQRVMAQELSDLPHAYPRHLDASDTARSLEWSAENERRPSLQEAGALARAVQRYLPYLEALSQAAAPNAHPVTRLDRPAAQGEDPRADGVLTFTAQTAALTYAPGPWAEHPGSRPLGTRGRLQPDELSPKVDGGAERQSSVAALVTAVARKPPAPHREDDPGPRHRLRGPWKTAQVLSAPAALQKWSLPPGDPEDPPALGDETLIRSLLKDLGRQPAPAEGLSPLELGEMAHMVAAAAQGAGADGELRAAEKEAAAKPREAGVRKQAGDSGADDRGPDGGGGLDKEVSHLGLKLGDHLQHPGPRLFPAAPLLMEPFKTEMKKSETPEVPLTWEEETAGVEDVRSQTYSKDRLDRPRPAQPRGRGFGELQAWVPGPSQEDAGLEARARGHPSEGLWLAARPSQEEEGYIVTGNDPLSPEKGKELMESVARLLEVPMSVFAEIAVLGPAVTFRVSASVRNLTAADVVQATDEDAASFPSGRAAQQNIGYSQALP